MAGSHSDCSTRKINNLLLTREINSLPRVLSVSLQSVRHYALQRCRSVSWSRSPSKSTVPDSVTPAPLACHSSRTLCRTDASVQRRTSPGHKHDQAKTVDIRHQTLPRPVLPRVGHTGLTRCPMVWYGARFYVPLETKEDISETFCPANLLAWYWKKQILTKLTNNIKPK